MCVCASCLSVCVCVGGGGNKSIRWQSMLCERGARGLRRRHARTTNRAGRDWKDITQQPMRVNGYYKATDEGQPYKKFAPPLRFESMAGRQAGSRIRKKEVGRAGARTRLAPKQAGHHDRVHHQHPSQHLTASKARRTIVLPHGLAHVRVHITLLFIWCSVRLICNSAVVSKVLTDSNCLSSPFILQYLAGSSIMTINAASAASFCLFTN